MPQIQAVVDRLDPKLLDPATEVAFRASGLTGEVVAALIGPGETRQYLRASDHLMDAGVVGVSLAQPAGRRFSAGVRLIAGESEIREQFGQVQVSVSATGFAQVNPQAAGLAYLRAAQLAGRAITRWTCTVGPAPSAGIWLRPSARLRCWIRRRRPCRVAGRTWRSVASTMWSTAAATRRASANWAPTSSWWTPTRRPGRGGPRTDPRQHRRPAGVCLV
ncbi:hypothetical protein ACFSC4_16815 [Deinococcus malanensis]|uniref:hypothetical protein n=1 Tax=Deinococcus malanensis TaxID=1706855 RepID=UPI00362EDE0D